MSGGDGNTTALSPLQMAAVLMRVAAARRVRDEAAAQESAIREAAANTLRPFVHAGLRKVDAMLPDGTPLGQLVFEKRPARITFDEAATTAYVEATAPSEIVETVDPSVLRDPGVIEWILKNRPEAINRSVRPKYLESLSSQLDHKGQVPHPDPEVKERVTIAHVVPEQYNGRFRWTPNPDHQAWLLTALTSKELDPGDVDTGLLSILPSWGEETAADPVNDSGQDEPAKQQTEGDN
ncbi:hypothetical protein MRI28_17495 [Nocardiopsis dassonvillei]|uniref:hypothetical protein n=1 Tax=Nocardiopsis dassonvillei TaxID=2014 RepID=UPI00200CF83B|nr:hypothetical protein [Nocardiopsis dassonvillei]MCK9871411.1 hypothetical protein [Nocardiopsis dassonvillei]